MPHSLTRRGPTSPQWLVVVLHAAKAPCRPPHPSIIHPRVISLFLFSPAFVCRRRVRSLVFAFFQHRRRRRGVVGCGWVGGWVVGSRALSLSLFRSFAFVLRSFMHGLSFDSSSKLSWKFQQHPYRVNCRKNFMYMGRKNVLFPITSFNSTPFFLLPSSSFLPSSLLRSLRSFVGRWLCVCAVLPSTPLTTKTTNNLVRVRSCAFVCCWWCAVCWWCAIHTALACLVRLSSCCCLLTD